MEEEEDAGASACLAKSSDGRYRVGGAMGQVWLLEKGEAGFKRTLLGDFELVSAVPMRVVLTETPDHKVFVFAGVLRQTQRALKIWFLGDTPKEIQLPKESKLKGLGSVLPLEMDSSIRSFRAVCGLGIGKAHVWRMEVDLDALSCQLVFEGSVVSRQNSISALWLYEGGKKLISITGTDSIVQDWTLPEPCGESFILPSKQGQVVRMDSLRENWNADDWVLLQKLSQGFNMNQMKSIQCVLASAPEWSLLFPQSEAQEDDQLLLSDSVYEGDLSASGTPHGFGTSFVQSDKILGVSKYPAKVLLYKGFWENGEQNGFGELLDEETGQTVYTGDWKQGKLHGRGTLRTPREEYVGSFLEGSRSGFGVLSILENCEVSREQDSVTRGKVRRRKRFAGESYAGFWAENEPSGVGLWTFPVTCPGLNQDRPDDIVHLGKIRCLVYHKVGTLVREFYFHRADKMEISPEDRVLLEAGSSKVRNKAFRLPFAFAPTPACVCVDVCWRCCESKNSSELMTCPVCYFRIHAGCTDDLSCPIPSCRNKLVSDLGPDSVKLEDLATESLPHDEEEFAVNLKRKKNRVVQLSQSSVKRSKLEQQEVLQAIEEARRLGKGARRIRYERQKQFFQDKIADLRKEELSRRKGWNAEKGLRLERLSFLDKQLQTEQHELLAKQHRLHQLQGQQLQSLRISGLTDLQQKLELVLDACRQALELGCAE